MLKVSNYRGITGYNAKSYSHFSAILFYKRRKSEKEIRRVIKGTRRVNTTA